MAVATQPHVLSASSIIGDSVKNAKGESLGDIKELMLDVETGAIAYAVLDFGGFLGIGNKLFAVPWQALELNAEKKCFLMNVEKETLKNAEGFDQDNWPDMADRRWGEQVHKHYGYDPYWH